LKKKGWSIIHVPEAEVFMMAPRTVPEYIHQRKRILVGHRQLEKITGTYPRTIGAMAWRKPFFLLKFLVHENKALKIRDYPKVLVGLSLEILARILATIDFRDTKKYNNWTQIRTTKTLNAITNPKRTRKQNIM
jgi:cellulose synthase/poly-beta-1,6-N-acetylglucosamine synthase-like glycosyltransferase